MRRLGTEAVVSALQSAAEANETEMREHGLEPDDPRLDLCKCLTELNLVPVVITMRAKVWQHLFCSIECLIITNLKVTALHHTTTSY